MSNTFDRAEIVAALIPDEHSNGWSDDLHDIAVAPSRYEGADSEDVNFAWQGVTLHNAHGSCYRRYRWAADAHPIVSREYALGLLAADRLHREPDAARVLVHRCHCLTRGTDSTKGSTAP